MTASIFRILFPIPIRANRREKEISPVDAAPVMLVAREVAISIALLDSFEKLEIEQRCALSASGFEAWKAGRAGFSCIDCQAEFACIQSFFWSYRHMFATPFLTVDEVLLNY